MLCITLEPYAAIQLDVKILIQFSKNGDEEYVFLEKLQKGIVCEWRGTFANKFTEKDESFLGTTDHLLCFKDLFWD